MKKAFLLFVATAAFSLTSCSGDDDSSTPKNPEDLIPVGTVTLKVNGVERTYNTITMSIEESDSPDDTYRVFTASQNGSSSELINFSIDGNKLGSDSMYNFEYITGSHREYPQVSTNVLANNNEALKATFSGSYTTWDNANQTNITTNITDGNVNISFE